MSGTIVRRRIVVSGRVQGVGYRYATQRQAAALGVRGWVRNTDDGKVEMLVEGDRAAVDALQAWCQRGPSGARVAHVVVSDSAAGEPLGVFSIAR